MENRVEELRKRLGMNQEDFVISDFFGKQIEEIFIHESNLVNSQEVF